MKSWIKNIAQQFGYDILHLPTNPTIRQQLDLLKQHKINLIFDIGANIGQYAQRLRKEGYRGEIISFEPLPDAYSQLVVNAQNDAQWLAVHTAVGNSDRDTVINVAANSYSSSLLDILPVHIQSAPTSVYTHQVNVQVQKIDSFIDRYYKPHSNLFVKIDTQGFEKQVFEGAIGSLSKIKGFQMELSLLPLYEGETLMQEMIDLLRQYGYLLKIIEAGHRNYDTGELLQVECYFYKE